MKPNPFDVGYAGFKFWREHELGKKLVRKIAPKFAARRDAKRAKEKAVKDSAGGEFFPDEETSMPMTLILELLGSLARTFLPAATAFLAGQGISVDGQNPALTIVIAIVIYVVMQVWSWARKIKRSNEQPKG